jgi:hypothetical protein
VVVSWCSTSMPAPAKLKLEPSHVVWYRPDGPPRRHSLTRRRRFPFQTRGCRAKLFVPNYIS